MDIDPSSTIHYANMKEQHRPVPSPREQPAREGYGAILPSRPEQLPSASSSLSTRETRGPGYYSPHLTTQELIERLKPYPTILSLFLATMTDEELREWAEE